MDVLATTKRDLKDFSYTVDDGGIGSIFFVWETIKAGRVRVCNMCVFSSTLICWGITENAGLKMPSDDGKMGIETVILFLENNLVSTAIRI